MIQTDSQQSFQRTQQAFAAHLRDPDRHPAPGHIEARRMGIYRDLVYNNIESFLANGFPVLRSISDDHNWHAMVRDFMRCHRCSSPYFLDIGKEFLVYLENERASMAADFPFLLELAHYEWVELALDIAPDTLPPEPLYAPDYLEDCATVSPLAWSLSYHYPVHRISVDCQPVEKPPLATFLVVYRNRDDQVRFLEINALTARLLQLLEEGGRSGREVFSVLFNEQFSSGLAPDLAPELATAVCSAAGDSDLQQFNRSAIAILEKMLSLSIISYR